WRAFTRKVKTPPGGRAPAPARWGGFRKTHPPQPLEPAPPQLGSPHPHLLPPPPPRSPRARSLPLSPTASCPPPHTPALSSSPVPVLAVALGIGANTAIFSVIDALLIRPLPYANPDRVVMVWEDAWQAGFHRNTPAPGNYNDWLRLNRSFTGIAAARGSTVNV